ncbi:MAG: TetR/AcrR family transcriptional regulator [Acidimicrobiales bacterium]
MSITSSLRERKKLRTRERLYDAALELFGERPYAEVTVDEICERAEVGRATYFRFYGSKGGLLVAFNRRLAERIEQRIAETPDATATDQLWVVQDEIARTWGSSGPAMREMAREYIRNITADDFAVDAPHPELVVLIAAIVRQGQASGEFTTGHHPRFVAWIVVAALSAVTAGWLGSGDDDTLAHGTRDAVELLLGGISRPAPPSNG